MDESFDLVIIGGGIVGLATAMTLARSYPDLHLAVIEKEREIARHQTDHNSGVIHSGIYYRPGSLKANLCVLGAQRLVQFCRTNAIPFELCGKLVVATEPSEIPRLGELYRRGTANGVPGLRLMGPTEAMDIEPHTRCLRALHVPTTGIVNFREVAQAYTGQFSSLGGKVLVDHRVQSIQDQPDGIRLVTSQGTILSRFLINCAGLYSDRVATMSGTSIPCRIVPFRGEYYQVRPERKHLVRGLIYPVPDPRFPFLGVHFTRMTNGKVEAGPNAVLAWAREGYRKSDIAWGELAEILQYKGFWHLVSRYWKPGCKEMIRSFSKARFAQALQKLVPEISREDLLPGGSGVRA
ncbi:MAG TPA: L-2-hydroxyglutarate oxidase, partial [Syntrophobacteraceae bacterium]|nr:L-2-hydroxyglutarate oxidase [Syntrophobacteraceae bacterium]